MLSSHNTVWTSLMSCVLNHSITRASQTSHSERLVGCVINYLTVFPSLSSSDLFAFGPKIQTNEKTSTVSDKLPVSGRSDEPSGRPDRACSSGGGGGGVCRIWLLMIIMLPNSLMGTLGNFKVEKCRKSTRYTSASNLSWSKGQSVYLFIYLF